MSLLEVHSISDPRVEFYRSMKDRELAARRAEEARRADERHDLRENEGIGGGLFVAEGELVVRRLLKSQYPVVSILLSSTRAAAMDDALADVHPAVPVYVAPQHVLNEVVGFNMHRGVLAIGSRGPGIGLDAFLEQAGRNRPLIILENVWNHDNIGGIFRSAAAFEAAGVVLCPTTADPFYRKSLRVSMGHVLGVPMVRCATWPDDLTRIRRVGWRVLALSPRLDADEIDDAAADQSSGPIAWLLGSEGPGLTPGAMAASCQIVRIPIGPCIDSLNVGVATAIALFAGTRKTVWSGRKVRSND